MKELNHLFDTLFKNAMMTALSAEIDILVGHGVTIKGNLKVPEDSESLVIFSHGSGSSRFSPRNKLVADVLNKHKMGTLLIDLLTIEEDQEYSNRFNIDLLAARLVNVTRYIQELPSTAGLSIGYFGASTGAASALKAAAQLQMEIKAVVSRGGRPDLAQGTLGKVKSPTLLLVGGLDHDVIILNRKALAVLGCEKKIIIVEGASHLFEEKGKLEEVAELACSWFMLYFK
jgi:predicted esterase